MKKDELNERHKAFNRWWKLNRTALHIERLPANQQDRVRSYCVAAYRAGWHDRPVSVPEVLPRTDMDAMSALAILADRGRPFAERQAAAAYMQVALETPNAE